MAALAFASSPVTAQNRDNYSWGDRYNRSSPTPTPTTSTKPIKPQYRNVRAFYRNVRAFWGDVNPFYRNVRAFWGDVDPFYRNVRAFWGTMDPGAMASAAGAPAYAGVGTFWEGLGTKWESAATPWQNAGAYSLGTAQTYGNIATTLKDIVATSKSFWGSAITKQTGKSFEAAFATPMLNKFGINLNDPSSLAKLSASSQSEFFITWYDGLMSYSGTDHADWWMRSINWSPALAQQAQANTLSYEQRPVLGLVDFYAGMDADVMSKTLYAGGVQTTNAHGAGVASLAVASHDGTGIMGVAPNSKVVAYNPYDTSESADWPDVINAIIQVHNNAAAKMNNGRGASVVNLSLGVPFRTLAANYETVFRTPQIMSRKDQTLYVIAAGNDGYTESGSIGMGYGAIDTTFIVVGSVGPDNKISEFSNRPGNACLTISGLCAIGSLSLKDSGYLKNRFIVAPGELILVSDGEGGVSRQTGTSLAAPLVSATAMLVLDRWPWLRDKPRDVAKVILDSATDLGAPGIDEVYGVGLLNVEGALSPLNFSKLTFTLMNSSGRSQGNVSVSTLLGRGIQSSWSANNMYFTAFEKLSESDRDFLIPLSSRLYGTTRNGDYFQDYVYNRMVTWIGGSSFTSGARGFADGMQSAPAEFGGWTMRMSGRLVSSYDADGRASSPELRSTVFLSSPSGKMGFSMGHGDGAVALGGGHGVFLAADFDPYSGGANPLLGFANGGTHAVAQMRLGSGFDVRTGFTEQRQRRRAEGERLVDANGLALLDRYRASAMTVEVGYNAAPWLRVTAAATNLREPNAVLGVRPIIGDDLAGGSRTNGLTFGADATLGHGLSVFGSATSTRALSAGNDSTLRIGKNGASGTSFQAGLAKHGLVGKGDALRLTVAQPLRLDGGSIELTEMQVVNRETGEKGVVTQRFSLAGTQPRRLVLESAYGAPILNGRAQLSLFGRGEMRDLDAGTPRFMLGSRLQLPF